MKAESIAYLFANIGVPTTCLVGLAWFCYAMVKKVHSTTMAREERLNKQIEKAQEINEGFERIIEKYSSRLDSIEDNVQDIKTDMIEIKAKIK